VVIIGLPVGLGVGDGEGECEGLGLWHVDRIELPACATLADEAGLVVGLGLGVWQPVARVPAAASCEAVQPATPNMSSETPRATAIPTPHSRRVLFIR
jgi:hypothetical protein